MTAAEFLTFVAYAAVAWSIGSLAFAFWMAWAFWGRHHRGDIRG